MKTFLFFFENFRSPPNFYLIFNILVFFACQKFRNWFLQYNIYIVSLFLKYLIKNPEKLNKILLYIVIFILKKNNNDLDGLFLDFFPSFLIKNKQHNAQKKEWQHFFLFFQGRRILTNYNIQVSDLNGLKKDTTVKRNREKIEEKKWRVRYLRLKKPSI